MKAKIILTTLLSLGIISFSNHAIALEKVTVAATPVPHAEILEVVKPILEKKALTYKLQSLMTTLFLNLPFTTMMLTRTSISTHLALKHGLVSTIMT